MRPSKPYSYTGLQMAAEYYLARYASSSHNLRRVLERKIQRRGIEDTAAAAQWLDSIVATMRDRGLLDDSAFAAMKTRSLRQRGASGQKIQRYLQQQGMEGETIAAAQQAFQEETAAPDTEPDTDEVAEITAARRYLQRTRRGHYRLRPATDDDRRKDMAALARQGFPYAIARAVLDAPESDGEEDGQ